MRWFPRNAITFPFLIAEREFLGEVGQPAVMLPVTGVRRPLARDRRADHPGQALVPAAPAAPA